MRITKIREEKMKKEDEEATINLSLDEVKARNTELLLSPVYNEYEGWLWNICWDKAREYYKKD